MVWHCIKGGVEMGAGDSAGAVMWVVLMAESLKALTICWPGEASSAGIW